MYTSYKVESLINSLAVSANLWNVLKCFPNTHSLNCFFYLYQQKMNTCYHINQICCCPRNIYNFWTHYSTEYFSSYATIQIEHAIDMKVKGIYFINFTVNLLPWTSSIERFKNKTLQRSPKNSTSYG